MDALMQFLGAVAWPDVVVGFIVGAVGAGLLGLPAQRRAKRDRVALARSEWLAAAGRIEQAIYSPSRTSSGLAALRATLEIDRWRQELGGADFDLFDQLINDLALVERYQATAATAPGTLDEEEVAQAVQRATDSCTEFVKRSRLGRGDALTKNVRREQAARDRREAVRNPALAFRRWRAKRRARSQI